MSEKKNSININSKFDPQDERIFCPVLSKSGVTGHGILKKYFIPHLDINICDYCEVEENGKKNNLHYYQSKNQSKHLIHELKNWRPEILKFQKINENYQSSNLRKVSENLDNSNTNLVKTSRSLNNCDLEIQKFKSIFDEKLITYIDFLEQIMQLKDILQELKFDEKGNLNVIAIGNDKEKEAKYVWMSLLFSKLKIKNLNVENFGLAEETRNLLENFVTLFVDLNITATNFVENLCVNLFPQIAELEKKNVTINKDSYLQRMPTVKNYKSNEKELQKITDLENRIVELEHIILLRDEDLEKKKFEMENLEAEKQKILNETNKINKSLLSEVERLNKINAEIIRENDELKRRLNEINDNNMVMSENNQENNLIISQLEKKLDELTDINNKFNKELNFSQNENKKNLLRIKELEELLNSQREKDQNLIDLKKQLNTEKENNADLNGKLYNLNLEKKDLLKKNNMYNEEILNLKLIINEKEKLLNLEKQENANKIFEYNLLVENLRSEINDQGKQNKEKLNEIKSLSDLNKSLANSLENNQILMNDNNNTLDRYVKKNQDLTLLNSKFSEEASHLKTRLTELENYITDEEKKNSQIFKDFDDKLKTYKNQNDYSNTVIKEQQLKLNNLNDQLSALNFQRNLLNDENEKNKTYLQNKESHINQYLEMIKKSEEDNAKLKNRINELEHWILEKENFFNNENLRMKENLEILKSENERLKNSLKNLQAKYDVLNNDQMVMSAETDQNNNLLEKLNKKLEEIYEENESNKNSLKLLTKENDDLKLIDFNHRNYYSSIIAEKDSKIKEYSLLLENQKNQILSFEKSNREKDKNLDDLIQANTTLSKEKNFLEKELLRLKSELNNENKKTAELTEKSNFLEKENLRLNQNVREGEESYYQLKSNYDFTVNNLNKNLEKLKEENENNRFNLALNLKKNEDLQKTLFDERAKNNKYVEDMNSKLNRLSQENSDLRKENLTLKNELDKINSIYDTDIENYRKENNAQLLEFKNNITQLENKLKEYADKNHRLTNSLSNVISENDENKRKIQEIPILEENIYRRKMQEANNNIVIENLGREINMLKNDNDSLRRQIDENEKLSRSLRSSIFRSSNNSTYSVPDNNEYKGNVLFTTTTNVNEPSGKNGAVTPKASSGFGIERK